MPILKSLFILTLSVIAGSLSAQNIKDMSGRPKSVAQTFQVSGILTDSTGVPVIGAQIKLRSDKDSAVMATSPDGIFIFPHIGSPVFTLSIHALGYRDSFRKYFFKDDLSRIILDPIIMGIENKMLNEVKINGTPTIKYKTDTVEYRARDFKVRENANINELLKKMEGFEVGSDNSVTYLGQKVMKAELNGKEYAGGDVALAIKTLPADIVEKIQVIDDYGTQALRTGIKNDILKKVLNITTQADKSVGTIIRPTGSAGNDNRLDERLFIQRINGNKMAGLIGSFENTVVGVSNSNSSLSTGNMASNNGALNSSALPNGGISKNSLVSLSYNDELGPHLLVNVNYKFNSTSTHTITKNQGLYYNNAGTSTNTFFNRNIDEQDGLSQHLFDVELEYNANKSNYLDLRLSLRTNALNTNKSFVYNQTGFINQLSSGNLSNMNSAPFYNATLFYQHIFAKPKRNISAAFDIMTNNKSEDDLSSNTITVNDSLMQPVSNVFIGRKVSRATYNTNYKSTVTYVEPVSGKALLEFLLQSNNKHFSDNRITDNVLSDQSLNPVDSLSRNYSYTFNDYRFVADYHYEGKSFKASAGVLINPSLLQVTNPLSPVASTGSLYILPVFRAQYNWSQEHNIQLTYSGLQSEPLSYQIQPVPDYADPQNPIIGNPGLRPSLKNTLYLVYNNYLANEKINLSTNITAVFFNNQIVPEIIQRFSADQKSYVYETHYRNVSGSDNLLANYSLSKQIDNRKYAFVLNGFIFRERALSFNNGSQNEVRNWRFNERFGPRIEPNDHLEINPFIAYDLSLSDNSLRSSQKTNLKTFTIAMDGRLHFLKNNTLTIGYNLSKNYINGITGGLESNPFIINAFLEKQVFKKRNGTFKFSIYDLLNQNKFIYRTINPNGYTDTNTNALSRYFLVSFSVNLQKWSGTPKRHGKEMKRRGDGSFYN